RARAADHVTEVGETLRGQGVHRGGEAELRRIRRADAEGGKDRTRLRGTKGIHRHFPGERKSPRDALRAPQDVWCRSRQARLLSGRAVEPDASEIRASGRRWRRL